MATRTYEERKQIQAMWEKGAGAKEIGEAINVPVTSVYAELRRGRTKNRLPDQRPRYDADLAQTRFREAIERRGNRGPRASRRTRNNQKRDSRKESVQMNKRCQLIVEMEMDGKTSIKIDGRNITVIVSAFIALDFITGWIKAVATNTYASAKMREGLFHKVGLALCVIFGYLVDYAQDYIDLGITVPVAAAICVYICLMETSSIIENICKINPDIMPEKLASLFGGLKKGD